MKVLFALGASLVALAVSVGSTAGPFVASKLSSPACEKPISVSGPHDYQGLEQTVADFALEVNRKAAKGNTEKMTYADYAIMGASFGGKSIVKGPDGKPYTLDGGTVEVVVIIQNEEVNFVEVYQVVVAQDCEGGDWSVLASKKVNY